MYELLKKHLAEYGTFSDQEFDEVCQRFQQKTTRRNEILLKKGKVCPCNYFVNKGCLRVYLIDKKGRDTSRFLITEGRFGTAFPSFISQEPSMAYLQSIEPSELLYIDHRGFRELFDLVPAWGVFYRTVLEKDYIDSIKRIEGLITTNAKERYDMLLESNPELIRRLPSRIIAGYLGISQETFSRLKSKR